MNLVVLTGRLTRDPEVKFGQSGKAYTKFSLAVDRQFSKGETDFINCAAFGKTAELIGEYLRKGSKMGITGSLLMNKYEVNGEKRTTFEVAVQNIEFLDSKGDSNNAKPSNSSGQSSYESKNNNPTNTGGTYTGANDFGGGFSEDDFPF